MWSFRELSRYSFQELHFYIFITNVCIIRFVKMYNILKEGTKVPYISWISVAHQIKSTGLEGMKTEWFQIIS